MLKTCKGISSQDLRQCRCMLNKTKRKVSWFLGSFSNIGYKTLRERCSFVESQTRARYILQYWKCMEDPLYTCIGDGVVYSDRSNETTLPDVILAYNYSLSE